MTEELLKKLHTAMCNDNEHQCNRLNNYIHTDEYLTAEVVQVVKEIIVEETKELQELYKKADENWWNAQQIIKELQEQIEKMKSDVIKSFGSEYNVLVTKLLKEWEIKENE